ncbi:MAG TPA: hypothetical protein VM681_00515 [Candidatus Thermoplasmatota archaeon]|nr:hypothetical protein [Candidatus Thermoplasmatota archaeon]
MRWADLTLVASPEQVQNCLQSLLAEEGFTVEWNGTRASVRRIDDGQGWGLGFSTPGFELSIHTSPGMFTVVRMAPVQSPLPILGRAAPPPRQILDALAMRLAVQGILRGVTFRP